MGSVKEVRSKHEKSVLGRAAKACGLILPSLVLIQASQQGEMPGWTLWLGITGIAWAVLWFLSTFA
jgi:hypothetical protein